MSETKLGDLDCVLSDKAILECKSEGSIIIEPFYEDQLSNVSYDVTLGSNYYVEDVTKIGEFYCPYNIYHQKDYWGEPKVALKIKDQSQADIYGCKVGDEVIIIPPGHTILAHTNEFIGGRKNITTMMKARSAMIRNCISTAKGGWGDVGFFNRWTSEIQNCGRANLVLVVGQKMWQIIFLRTSSPLASYEEAGSYQKGTNIIEIMANWTPSSMLPKTKRCPNRTFNIDILDTTSDNKKYAIKLPVPNSPLTTKGYGSPFRSSNKSFELAFNESSSN